MSDKPGNENDAGRESESVVARAYDELKNSGPSAALDAKILAAAREATQQDSTVVQMRRWRKWSMPAALAATVVFAVPLVVRVFNNVPVDLEQNTITMTAPKVQAEAEYNADSAKNATERRALATNPQITTQMVEQPQQAPHTTTSNYPTAAPAETDKRQLGSGFSPAPPDASTESTRPALAKEQAADLSAMEMQDERMAGARSRSDDTAIAVSAVEPAVPASASRKYRSQENMASAIEEVADGDINATAMDSSDDSAGKPLQPDERLRRIAIMMELGQIDVARKALGSFFQDYPAYALPENFPLQKQDAIYTKDAADDTPIIPAAEPWLEGIGQLAEQGHIDRARIQLAKFFRFYPNYPLPDDFPLSRQDAAPIER